MIQGYQVSCFAERKDRTELEAKDKFFERWALEACLLFLCLVSTLCLFFATQHFPLQMLFSCVNGSFFHIVVNNMEASYTHDAYMHTHNTFFLYLFLFSGRYVDKYL